MGKPLTSIQVERITALADAKIRLDQAEKDLAKAEQLVLSSLDYDCRVVRIVRGKTMIQITRKGLSSSSTLELHTTEIDEVIK